MPSLLLFLALLVLGESLEQIFALLKLLVSVRVHDHSQILHESEVGSHGIRESSQLTELRDESDLISSLPVLVDQERLVGICDVFIVPGLVVLSIAHLGAVLVERGRWAHAEVNSLDSISLLVVASDYCTVRQSM